MFGFHTTLYDMMEGLEYCGENTATYPIFKTDIQRYLFGYQVVSKGLFSVAEPFPGAVWALTAGSTVAFIVLMIVVREVSTHGLISLACSCCTHFSPSCTVCGF